MSDIKKFIKNEIPEENTKDFIKWKKELLKLNGLRQQLGLVSVLLRGPEEDRDNALKSLNVMGMPTEKITDGKMRHIYRIKLEGQDEWNSFNPK